ncbi:nudix (nucleoside diphosphate linked moiety X)-type motif 8 [Coemansia sp. RSA 2424]|nr:nudix (nucleoside diphosphate linked moiety X)-type motif 8 [Coemansia sp. RSA 2424]
MTTPPLTALDDAGLDLVRRRLLFNNSNSSSNAPAKDSIYNFKFAFAAGAGEAAVLLLLCQNEHQQPGILFEERHRQLSSHGGEACFAGGKADAGDLTLVHTALREAHEELGLDPGSVSVLGRLPPVPNKTGSLRVHPIIGATTCTDIIRSLTLNRDEVHRAFFLPLEHFYDPRNVAATPVFRNTGLRIPIYSSDKQGLRIWGLTAFILHEFLRRINDNSSNDNNIKQLQ